MRRLSSAVAGAFVSGVALASAGASAGAADVAADPARERPRIGLVLSGGGARGAAHVGVLEVLEELRIPVDRIVGTSMGSIVGGLYATGMSPQELRQAIVETDWVTIFKDQPDRPRRYYRRKEDDSDLLVRYKLHLEGGVPKLPSGVLQGQRLSNRLQQFEERKGAPRDFDRLPIPYRAVAADLVTGQPVAFKQGHLAQAIRASMSIPGVFRPVRIEGRDYVDGGVAENLPVRAMLQEFDVDTIIAVNISTPLDSTVPESAPAVVRRMLRFLTSGNVEVDRASLRPGDLFLEPALGEISVASFDRVGEAIELGHQSARAMAADLSRLSVSEEEYARYLASQRRPDRPAPVVTAVEVAESGPVRPEIVAGFITQPLGEPLDGERLEHDLVRLHGLGYHDPIVYALEETAGGTTVRVFAPRLGVGLSTLQFGLNIEDDFRGGNEFTLSARYQVLALNRRGAEWRNDLSIGEQTRVVSEFYQPFDRRLRYFAAPFAEFREDSFLLFLNGSAVASIRGSEYGAGLDLGRNLGTWGQLRLGFERAVVSGTLEVGIPIPVPRSIDVARRHAILRYDLFDAPAWPAHGGRGSLEWAKADAATGGETRAETVDVIADWAFSLGRTHVLPGFEVSLNLSGQEEAGEGYSLGGLFRLSGYGPEQLFGAEGVLARTVAYRQLNRAALRVVPKGFYVGVAAEAGNVYPVDRSIDLQDLLYGGAVFMGADTPFGPLILGAGYTQPSERRVFLSFGRSFF